MKDHVKTDGIEIQHCPTDKMLADFFTKPLQGSLFCKIRDVLLGYKHINRLKSSNMPGGCVENSEIGIRMSRIGTLAVTSRKKNVVQRVPKLWLRKIRLVQKVPGP
jgi:hypothetical protein